MEKENMKFIEVFTSLVLKCWQKSIMENKSPSKQGCSHNTFWLGRIGEAERSALTWQHEGRRVSMILVNNDPIPRQGLGCSF